MRKEAQEILEKMRQDREESLNISAVKPTNALPISARQIVKQTPLASVTVLPSKVA
jgi:hypothetical protein